MEQRYPIVKSHQTMKRLSLMRADDVDDRVVVLLRVNVLGARGLPAADSDGKSDPYCVVQPAPGVSAKTRPVMNTLDPLWHRAFTFTAPCGLRRSGNSVVLSVIDYDGYDEADGGGDEGAREDAPGAAGAVDGEGVDGVINTCAKFSR